MTFQTEFPDYPVADFPALPEGFTDTSWKNDACPCMTNSTLGLLVYADYLDPTLRNFGEDQPRFSVLTLDKDGSVTGEDSLLDTNEWSEVLALIAGKVQ